MDIQQIVLIVLGILYFLFRKSGSKEQRQPAKQTNKETKSTPSIEDILRELSGQPATVQPKVVPKDNKIHLEHQEDIFVRKPVLETPPSVLGKSPSTLLKKVVLEDDESGNADFDLRQAIIYDAILNRPYQ